MRMMDVNLKCGSARICVVVCGAVRSAHILKYKTHSLALHSQFLNAYFILPFGLSICARDRISCLYDETYYTPFPNYLLGVPQQMVD